MDLVSDSGRNAVTEERFSQPVVEMLTAAGWSPGRRFSALSTLTRLTAAGYTVHAAAEEFLAEFAGLRLVHDPTVTLPTGTVRTSFTVFDPSRAASPMEVNWTRQSAQALGLSLCPIGTDSFHSTLHLADDGSVHSANGSRVYTFAKDVPGFLAVLATGDRPHFVLDWSTQSSDFESDPGHQPTPVGTPRQTPPAARPPPHATASA
jgi:hypothetical protein